MNSDPNDPKQPGGLNGDDVAFGDPSLIAARGPYMEPVPIRCPACNSASITTLLYEGDSAFEYRCCNSEDCKCEFSIHRDGAGNVVSTILSWVPGMDDGEESI